MISHRSVASLIKGPDEEKESKVKYMQKLIATRREGTGKEASRKVRNAGKIPAVLYGFGVENSNVSVDPKNLDQALSNPKGSNGYFEVELDGETLSNKALIRELQRHPVTRRILHVDLVVPNPSETLVTTVPLNFIGRSIGVQMGGRMRRPYREVQVSSLPENIPANITVDITPLDQGDALTASQLDAGEGQVVFDRDFVVVKVVAPRGQKA